MAVTEAPCRLRQGGDIVIQSPYNRKIALKHDKLTAINGKKFFSERN